MDNRELLKAYIKILEEELDEVTPIAWVQGYRSTRLKEIRELEIKIKELEENANK